jgi:hypothetical protein
MLKVESKVSQWPTATERGQHLRLACPVKTASRQFGKCDTVTVPIQTGRLGARGLS